VIDVFLGWYLAALEPHHVGRIVDLPRDAKDVEQITDELNRMFSFWSLFSWVLFFEYSCYS
jgi:hypothetical protein